jgi:2-hydroxychromene-2-carboxylate isomerase
MNPQFLFDFGSPNTYFSHRVIPEIEQRTGVEFDYVPVLLGGIFKLTNNKSPVEAFRDVKNKLAFQEIETKRFCARHNITAYQYNPFFPVNTLLLMRCAVAAQLDGGLETYVEAVYHYMWEEPRKMDDPAVVRDSLVESGLDADRLLARAQDADVKGVLMQNTQNAVDRGAFGAPTFFVGNDMFFGKDQLRDVEEAIVAAKS